MGMSAGFAIGVVAFAGVAATISAHEQLASK
jgi:hypothetical protein